LSRSRSRPPSPPPSWQQGRSGEQEKSSLHPFAINVTGKMANELPIDRLKVPTGFKVEVWAEGVPAARSLALATRAPCLSATAQAPNVYAVVDPRRKTRSQGPSQGLDSPNGVVFSKGTLYVAERNRITRYDGVENSLDNPPAGKGGHSTTSTRTRRPAISGNSSRWVPTASSYFKHRGAGQHRHALGTWKRPIHARRSGQRACSRRSRMGVRNSVGMDFQPQTGELWFTNHGRDWLGDNSPKRHASPGLR